MCDRGREKGCCGRRGGGGLVLEIATIRDVTNGYCYKKS